METWEIRTDDQRKADTLPLFIIFCEDEVSERIYFDFFETSSIKVNTIPGQKSKMDNVLKAITHCVSNGLLSHDGGSSFDPNEVQVWCVFDRDKDPNPDEMPLGNTKFNTAIKAAQAKGIQVAWSNDAFELWVLLHFEDVDPGDKSFIERKMYYQRLTEIFKAMPNPNEDLTKVLAFAGFNYKQSLKSPTNFRNIVRSALVRAPLTSAAIQRAKALENHFSQVEALHEKVPCTMVYKLVEELLRLGNKSLE